MNRDWTHHPIFGHGVSITIKFILYTDCFCNHQGELEEEQRMRFLYFSKGFNNGKFPIEQYIY